MENRESDDTKLVLYFARAIQVKYKLELLTPGCLLHGLLSVPGPHLEYLESIQQQRHALSANYLAGVITQERRNMAREVEKIHNEI